MRADGTVTRAEAEVLAVLRAGPAVTAGETDPRRRFVHNATVLRLRRSGLVDVVHGEARLTPAGERAVGERVGREPPGS